MTQYYSPIYTLDIIQIRWNRILITQEITDQ